MACAMLDRKIDKPDHYSAYPERINIDDETILARWSQHFGCTPQLLKEAVFDVGEDPKNVATFLASRTAHPYDASGADAQKKPRTGGAS